MPEFMQVLLKLVYRCVDDQFLRKTDFFKEPVAVFVAADQLIHMGVGIAGDRYFVFPAGSQQFPDIFSAVQPGTARIEAVVIDL